MQEIHWIGVLYRATVILLFNLTELIISFPDESDMLACTVLKITIIIIIIMIKKNVRILILKKMLSITFEIVAISAYSYSGIRSIQRTPNYLN